MSERASRLMEEARARNWTTAFITAVSGLAIGLLVGVLFAPTSGFETRQRIGGRAREMAEKARETAAERAEQVSEEAERIA